MNKCSRRSRRARHPISGRSSRPPTGHGLTSGLQQHPVRLSAHPPAATGPESAQRPTGQRSLVRFREGGARDQRLSSHRRRGGPDASTAPSTRSERARRVPRLPPDASTHGCDESQSNDGRKTATDNCASTRATGVGSSTVRWLNPDGTAMPATTTRSRPAAHAKRRAGDQIGRRVGCWT